MKKLMNFRWGSILLLSILLLSCSSSSPDDDGNSSPTGLVMTLSIQGVSASNPNGDGSGKINLDFSAKNATLYKINFGNGETLETTKTSLSYTYTGSGIKTYEIFVSAYNADKFISTSETITIYVTPGLTWADEFNTPGTPNSANWGYDIGGGGWGNNESQYYTNRPENVKVENGLLKITARKENYEGAAYTSARLKTQGKFNFKYGKVEVRAKLPQGGGTWPAIWMLGSNINTVGWPACGEVDIMEHVGNNPGTVLSAIHTPSSYGGTINHGSKPVPDATSEFHVYAINWTAQKMEFSVDDQVFYTYNPTEKNADTWPFDKDQFIILN
ncbi:MAG: glycoside hydrolase family 16 protein, partial [Salinimicrobium sp.]